jgi:hypothetical protein
MPSSCCAQSPSATFLQVLLMVVVIVLVIVGVLVAVDWDERKIRGDVCGPCASSSRQLPAACHIFHHLTSGFANVRILFSRTRSQWSAILIFTNIDANKALSVAIAGNTPRPRTWLIPNSSKPGRKGDRAAVRNAILHRFAQIELCLKL